MFVARFSQAKHVYVVVAGRLKVIRDDVSAAATDGLPGAYAVLVFLAHHVFDYTGGHPLHPVSGTGSPRKRASVPHA